MAKQIEGIGPAIAKRFAENGADSFSKLRSLASSRIDFIAGKKAPFGSKLKVRSASTHVRWQQPRAVCLSAGAEGRFERTQEHQ